VTVISGTGLYTPPFTISNDELVAAFNAYVDRENAKNAAAIAAGTLARLEPSSTAFIEKASGIKSRHVVEKSGILDPDRMAPIIPERANDELSLLAEIAVAAGTSALEAAEKEPEDIDGVIVACSNLQRPYPAIAIEVQWALGIEDGFAFDMNVACSSATFAIQAAAGMIEAGQARSVLILNPEICSAHLNFRDRDSHFIFGDVATALVLERDDFSTVPIAYEVVGTRLKTRFSNNIRNNFGFLNRCAAQKADTRDRLFVQEGRRVFKEVVPMVAELVLQHLSELDISPREVSRLWLHQANQAMNDLIAERVLGRRANAVESPIILDEYANTSSAGSIIAFHKYKDDLAPDAVGVICSFGAGYSAGSVVVRRV
jgi:beta-ketodecanoyl-[acyl-carrier-protein] synthase